MHTEFDIRKSSQIHNDCLTMNDKEGFPRVSGKSKLENNMLCGSNNTKNV